MTKRVFVSAIFAAAMAMPTATMDAQDGPPAAPITALPFHLARHVTRKEHEIDQRIIDERDGPMPPEQRAPVRSAIACHPKTAPMQEPKTFALRSC